MIGTLLKLARQHKEIPKIFVFARKIVISVIIFSLAVRVMFVVVFLIWYSQEWARVLVLSSLIAGLCTAGWISLWVRVFFPHFRDVR